MRGTGLLCAITLCCWHAGAVRAGECLDGDEAYIEVLEKRASADKGQLDEALHCLKEYAGCTPGPHNDRWAGARAARCFAEGRNSPHRARLERVCKKILDKDVAHDTCIVAAARFGFASVGDHDIYELLLKRKQPPTPRLLVALGDPRAVPYLIERYRQAEVDEGGKLTKNRWDVKRSKTFRQNVLNAMWHFADERSAEFLAQVADNDPDKSMRSRAGKALQEVEERSRRRR